MTKEAADLCREDVVHQQEMDGMRRRFGEESDSIGWIGPCKPAFGTKPCAEEARNRVAIMLLVEIRNMGVMDAITHTGVLMLTPLPQGQRVSHKVIQQFLLGAFPTK